MNTGWLYLIIASLSEACWLYAIKFLSVQKLRDLGWNGFFSDPLHARAVLPFLGYAVFGAGNVVFLSMSMRQIPASTAFAVWMGIALVGTKLIDVLYFKEGYNGMQVLWFACILVGIIGLKRNG